ncbi:bola-like protein-domain-containing protein [Spinellus fusiger]|nr:bola-like protein-domain-containing protein [Spinellus fusiger]KAI7863517.1 bola-like protein-domain-containing protein [Spinellus fusiger]
MPRSKVLSVLSLLRVYSTTKESTPTRFLNEFVAVEKGPLQLAMETKARLVIEALNPPVLEIINESHLHAHHAAMKDTTEKETHFRMIIVSEAFDGKTMMQRHRMVYQLLGDEFRQSLHALSLKTKTSRELDPSK